MSGWLLEPWREPLFVRAWLEVAVLALAAGPLGAWIVLHRLSFAAESLAHGLLPGLVLAALLGLPVVLGGALGALVGALVIAAVRRLPDVDRDAGTSVVVSGLLGLGALLALSPEVPAALRGILFGRLTGASAADVLLGAGLVVVLLSGLALSHHRLLAAGLDPGWARSSGLAPSRADVLLAVLMAVALVVAVQGLGNLLAVAVLVAPAAAARHLAHRVPGVMAWATALALAAGTAGLYASYHASLADGASVALAAVLLWVLVRVGHGAGRRLGAPRRRDGPLAEAG